MIKNLGFPEKKFHRLWVPADLDVYRVKDPHDVVIWIDKLESN